VSVRRWIAVVVVGGFAVAVSVVVAHLLGAEFGTFADWLAAIGTIAAVGFAVTEIRRADRDGEQERAAADARLQRQLEHSRSLMETELRVRTEAEDRRWLVDHLLDLLYWWDRYTRLRGNWTPIGEVPQNLEERAQVRSLISALPSQYARIAALAVGIERRPYAAPNAGPEQVMDIPDINNIGPARLEIEWDLQYVQRTNDTDSARDYILRRFEQYVDDRDAQS
jgi:hypothetical protein